ncbi:hypothetical protein ILUMI_04259 [Ignelater luminosus]|uniref:Peptidase S1 domain-containing protein n=1 Tax=Ignelater luminosus TaxID=2038154 RepID=A0A8K0D9G3_IGNLU|nr:hypothetical protein ILUMI_04259 [Ignelater luminosus]
MKVLILITIVALVAAAQAARDWSKIKPKHLRVTPRIPAVAPRIVGGLEAEPYGVPYQAAVISGGAFCGGSIISDNAVLTAAHCVDGAGSAEAILSAHNILEDEPEQQIIKSKAIKVHEGWDPYRIVNDIAVVILSEKIRIDYTAMIVSLNTDSSSLEGELGLVSGWGLDSDSSSSISPILRYTLDLIISNKECERFFGGFVTKTNVCLNGSNGRSACSGDSGGPLFIQSPWDEPIQAGIVSFGSAAGCEKGYPSVYTRVSEYTDWIEQQLA